MCKSTMTCSNGITRKYLRCKGLKANGGRCSNKVREHDFCWVHRNVQWKKNEFKMRRSKSTGAMEELQTQLDIKQLITEIAEEAVEISEDSSISKIEEFEDIELPSNIATTDSFCPTTFVLLYTFCMFQLLFLAYLDYCRRMETETFPQIQYNFTELASTGILAANYITDNINGAYDKVTGLYNAYKVITSRISIKA